MRIALFYPRNTFASWYALGGYYTVLRNMGHEVIDVPLPGNKVENIHQVKAPTIEELKSCDCILIAYAEYVVPWLKALYGIAQWRTVKTPKIARFDETFDRDDLNLDWEQLRPWSDFNFFPAKQDADRFKGEFLPYGADTNIFKPSLTTEKQYNLGFIGQMYPVRQKYAQLLLPHIPEVTFHGGPCIIADLSGAPPKGWEVAQTQLLAENYRQIKVFFCLPPMSQLLVAKVFEVMSCGTFVMYPRLEGEGRENLHLFSHQEHLVYYTLGDFEGNARDIRYWIAEEHLREKIAKRGCEKVHIDYTLRKMMEAMLVPVAVAA